MDAHAQQAAAAAFERTGYHFYYPDSDGSGNMKRLTKVSWATALVLIQRGETRGWILAKDATESDPRQLALVADGPEGGA